MGENCQKKSVPCSTATSRDYCHAHAQCIMVDPQSNKYRYEIYEPPRGKTNNVVSEQV